MPEILFSYTEKIKPLGRRTKDFQWASIEFSSTGYLMVKRQGEKIERG